MKEITIFQENIEPIILIDDDKSSIEEYSKELSKLLKFNNVSVLNTSSASILLKPKKIVSIEVKEILSKLQESVDDVEKSEPKIEGKNIISDAK